MQSAQNKADSKILWFCSWTGEPKPVTACSVLIVILTILKDKKAQVSFFLTGSSVLDLALWSKNCYFIYNDSDDAIPEIIYILKFGLLIVSPTPRLKKNFKKTPNK